MRHLYRKRPVSPTAPTHHRMVPCITTCLPPPGTPLRLFCFKHFAKITRQKSARSPDLHLQATTNVVQQDPKEEVVWIEDYKSTPTVDPKTLEDSEKEDDDDLEGARCVPP
jgi:hypothetical protein